MHMASYAPEVGAIKPRNGAIQFVKTENAVETVAVLINAATGGI